MTYHLLDSIRHFDNILEEEISFLELIHKEVGMTELVNFRKAFYKHLLSKFNL